MQTQEQSVRQDVVLSDGALVEQALTGDQQAFELLVRRYNTQLFNFIYHLLGDYDQTCDILQDVFVRLYLSLPTLSVQRPLKPWLLQVAHHRSVDELRRIQRRPSVFLSELEISSEDDESPWLSAIADNGPLPEELAEQHDLQRLLLQAIQALPPKFRSIVLLRYMGQLNFSEIGSILHIPEATAKTYFLRAKPQLRASLEGVRQNH
jgi:RNA polymerase sigma factor (sigma-70 family)